MKKIFRCNQCYSLDWDEWGLDAEKILEDNPENRRAFASEYCDVDTPEINDFINMKENEFNTGEIDHDWDEASIYSLEVIDISDEIKKLSKKIEELQKIVNKDL